MKLRKKLTLGMIAIYLFSIMGIALTMHFMGDRFSDNYIAELSRKDAPESVNNPGKSNITDKAKSPDTKITTSESFSIETFVGPFVSEVFKELLPKLFSKI